MVNTLGERIKIRREKAGLTQEKLATIIQQRRDTVAKWENGSRVPSIYDIAVLAEALKTSTDYLILGRKHENQTAYSSLGLSDGAIDSLQFFVQQEDEAAINFANGMLEDWDIFGSLAANISVAAQPNNMDTAEEPESKRAIFIQHMDDFMKADYKRLLAYEHLRFLVDSMIQKRQKTNGEKKSR